MSAIRIGVSDLIWGVKDPLPLKDFPSGKVKLRIRNTDFVQAFVKTSNGIRRFYVAEADGFWVPKFEQGRNEMGVAP